MPRGNGGIIGPVNTSFSGVWSLTEAQLRRSGGTWPNFYAALLSESATGSDAFTVGAAADEYFEYTTLLLPGNGTNGAQNNTFLDGSTNNFTITRNGNTTQGTFSPFSQTGWGNYLSGSSQYLTVADSTDFDLTSDYTIELWFYPNVTGGLQRLFMIGDYRATYNGIDLYVNASNQVVFYSNGASIITGGTVTNFQWNHVALVRNGGGANNTTLYINGTSVGQATNTTSFTGVAANGVSIGLEYSGAGTSVTTAMYVSNARLVKGTPVYTSNFTPPTSPLTAITNTVLLTCQSNRFVDANTQVAAKTITANGSPTVVAFSPFNPTASWSAATYGGSGYFDGSGDYLTVPDSTAFDLNTTFTVELWFYQTVSGNASFFSRGGGSGSWSTTNGHEYLAFIETGTLYWMWNNSGSPASVSIAAPSINTWNHFAIGYNGTTTRAWLNGVSIGTSVSAYTLPTTRNVTRVGVNPDGVYPTNGYVSSLRVVKGTDVYGVSNTTITVPTAPLTAITNTSLLLNFTNAGIYDATSKNDLETVGNAQISTAISAKWGSGSMYFDGNGDGLYRPNTDLLNLGTGNFTIEFWLNFSSKTGYQTIASFGYSPIASTGWLIQTGNGDGKAVFYSTTAPSTTTVIATDTGATVNTGQWYHVAIVRNAGTTTIYRDGTSVGSGSDSTNYSSSTAVFYTGGGSNTGFNNYYLNGYLQDVRITKGIARYTSNFTAPTAAFPTL